MRHFLIGLFATCMICQSARGQNASEPPSAAAIKKWIADLDSRNFKTRSIAESRLLESGGAGEAALLEVIAQTKSLDLAQRAQKIVTQIRQKAVNRITDSARQATAVIETPTRRLRPAGVAAVGAMQTSLISAFCIHSSGIFVTAYDGVRYANGVTITIPLILFPGTPNQATFKATVVRSDTRLNTAILQVQTNHTFPCVALGSTKGISELVKVFALGSLGQKAVLNGKPQYPAVTANIGTICSLAVNGGVLDRIQIDTGDNMSAHGGPLLNEQGRVIGILIAGPTLASGRRLPTTAVQVGVAAMPIESITPLFAQPILQFIPPKMTQKTSTEPCDFQAKIIHILSGKKSPDVDLILVANGIARRHKMVFGDGVYRVNATPAPMRVSPTSVRVGVAFQNGRITANMNDQAIQLGNRKLQLSELRSLQIKPNTVEATLADGRKFEGPWMGDDTLSFTLGGVARKLALRSVTGLTIQPNITATQLTCQIVAVEGGADRVLWQGNLPVLPSPNE